MEKEITYSHNFKFKDGKNISEFLMTLDSSDDFSTNAYITRDTNFDQIKRFHSELGKFIRFIERDKKK